MEKDKENLKPFTLSGPTRQLGHATGDWAPHAAHPTQQPPSPARR
jgi:hypothetical protein